jgi:hypothetical protein
MSDAIGKSGDARLTGNKKAEPKFSSADKMKSVL